LIAGKWYNLTCGSCSGGCNCAIISEALLPAPVKQIVEVKVDGLIVPTGSYRVDDNRLLVRTDGGLWPICNNLARPDTQMDTWSVTAKFGQTVPAGGEWAVGELACEMVKAMQGQDCRLPKTVTSLARQGVTITFPDLTTLFDKQRTGLYLVDLFLTTWNPSRLRHRSGTYSVDRAKPRRTYT
jgi:hypothetical protein